MTDSMDMNLGKLPETVRDSKPGMLQTRLSNSTTNKNTHVTNIPNKIQTISITPESSLEDYAIFKRHFGHEFIFVQLHLHVTCVKREVEAVRDKQCESSSICSSVIADEEPNDKGYKSKNNLKNILRQIYLFLIVHEIITILLTSSIFEFCMSTHTH